MKFLMVLILAFTIQMMLGAQATLLEQPDKLEKISHCLNATYGFRFTEAERLCAELEHELPSDPAPDFLKALIIYWKNFPLLPEDTETEIFIQTMNSSLAKASRLLEANPDDIEGVFFDIHTRAFMAMFWADNGKPGKVLKDIDNMYRQTLHGMEMLDRFNEFYFSSGLYNYYIEAYTELHPVYKPLTVLFRSGNKKVGLMQLDYAIQHTSFIKYEAILFMSLIQLNYEKNLEKALKYAAILYNNFPENTYFTGHYAMILLYSRHYVVAEILLEKLKKTDSPYSQMLWEVLEGFMQENHYHNIASAKKLYYSSIEKSRQFGHIANLYQAIAYAGLSRIEEKNGNEKMARQYQKKSSSLSGYDFILSF